jgi:hypothetical protein
MRLSAINRILGFPDDLFACGLRSQKGSVFLNLGDRLQIKEYVLIVESKRLFRLR